MKGADMGLFAGSESVQRLVDDHYLALYRYAYRLSGNSVEAEDLTQETYCKAQACLSQLRDAGRAKPWLFRILRNLYLHKVRSAKSHVCVSLDDLGELPEQHPAELPEIDPESLQEALAELPEAFRTPIILYYFEDFSYRDIAEHMDLPIGTVMSRLARAKTHLRVRLTLAEPDLALGQRRASNGL
jgi:RNA polymerase sigma-70 factor (ECF subfamily)